MVLPALRAPREQGELLAVPPLATAGELLQANRDHLQTASLRIAGQPLAVVRQDAIAEVLAAASAYLARHGLTGPSTVTQRLIVCGHQPELFHPGVWIKNFAAWGLARKHGYTSLNLIVDNDVAKHTQLRVPVERGGTYLTRTVPLDAWAGPVPWEERPVRDEAVLAAVPRLVTQQARGWGFEPILPDFWRGLGKGPLLAERLAVGRRRYEERWGCHNLELPLSQLCETRAFGRFLGHLLHDLPRFHAAYNARLQDYRQRHGIRGHHHPVSDLGSDGVWLEAPFWVWPQGSARRHRLFVRRTEGHLDLRCGDQVIARCSASGADGLELLHGRGPERYKIRTRALTTTLFVRLLLADLFIHGIGGAIYDELTDDLFRTYFELTPPRFLVLSATLRLPLPAPRVSSHSRSQLQRRLRDLLYNADRLPEVVAALPEPARRLCSVKAREVAGEPATAAEKVARWRTLRHINEQLRADLQMTIQGVRNELAQVEGAEAALQVINDREYAFCLHPEHTLRQLMEQVL